MTLAFDPDPLRDALARCTAEGVTLRYWWRDDDAVEPTPALDRLLALSHETGIPVALAIVPGRADPRLKDHLASLPGTDVLVHGLAHRNHAPPDLKKAEFGANRPLSTLMADARAALAMMEVRLPGLALPVLVPPWNRIAEALEPHLSGIGYRGLSTFGPALPAPAGLVRVNTHIDPIGWKMGGGLADPTMLVARLAQAIHDRLDSDQRGDEPIGLLTHHLVHDEEVWRFVRFFLDTFRASPATKAMRAAELFTEAPA